MVLNIIEMMKATPARLRKNDKLKLGNVKVRVAAAKYLPKEVQQRLMSTVRKNRRARRQKKQEIGQHLRMLKQAVTKMTQQKQAEQQQRLQQQYQQSGAAGAT